MRLITRLPYTTNRSVKTTPVGEHGCSGGTTVTDSKAEQIDSFRLEQIRGDASEAVYRVVSAEHSDSQPTTWQDISGTLVFTHAD